MSKQIRLEERVYYQLDDIRDKRETFSEAVGRLIGIYRTIKEVSDTLGPSHFLKEEPSIDARTEKNINGGGISSPVRDL